MNGWCWPLRHRFRPVSVLAVRQAPSEHFDATEVLHRCERCPAVRTKRIPGVWNLDVIVGGQSGG